jgi:hypothetical protein
MVEKIVLWHQRRRPQNDNVQIGENRRTKTVEITPAACPCRRTVAMPRICVRIVRFCRTALGRSGGFDDAARRMPGRHGSVTIQENSD